MATVVVTGASGFVGRYLTAYLASCGFNVTPVSRRPSAGMFAVQDYSQCPPGDALVHLAEEPNRGKVNRLGAQYVIESAIVVKALSSRFRQSMIYASSGMVYGDQNESPCRIGTPIAGTDVYSCSKLRNEQIVLEAGGAVARLSNLIGIGMATNNVISDIIHQIFGSGSLHVRDDRPVRDFLSVSDATAGFGALVESEFRGIVNIGSGVGTSVRALAELALGIAGQQDRTIIATEPSCRRSINVLDITETSKALGWAPVRSLKSQLSELLCNIAM